ncbi:hypothetical protein GALL_421560 [mine drainage metagenome]|uniref:Uncharacterized protein n=1 Tax=mine drainage metagenome TaxID=410659 RepID=A0A1J5Q837_9ZZZZ
MLSNPKAAVQYGVIFAAMLPQSPSQALTLLLPPAVFLLEVSWYLFVAVGLSSTRPRDAYLKAKAAIDRTVCRPGLPGHQTLAVHAMSC